MIVLRNRYYSDEENPNLRKSLTNGALIGGTLGVGVGAVKADDFLYRNRGKLDKAIDKRSAYLRRASNLDHSKNLAGIDYKYKNTMNSRGFMDKVKDFFGGTSKAKAHAEAERAADLSVAAKEAALKDKATEGKIKEMAKGLKSKQRKLAFKKGAKVAGKGALIGAGTLGALHLGKKLLDK